MARRPFLFFALYAILTACLSLPAIAQSGRTFYIDYSSGSNSNPGTQSAPWKTHPYMQTGGSCTGSGSAPSYSHSAGDKFLFKGGVKWPGACFPMTINNGGSSASVLDTYTADQNWYNGSAFANPQFWGDGGVIYKLVDVNASNVLLSYLDMGGESVAGFGGQVCGAAVVAVESGYQNVMVSYSKLHDWIYPSPNSNYDHSVGGMCYFSFATGVGSNVNNVTLDHSEVRDDANMVGGSSVPFGVCGRNINIQYSTCHYLFEGIVDHGNIHDNEFGNLNYPPANVGGALNAGAHQNIIEDDTSPGDGDVYNNWIHDATNYGETIQTCGGQPGVPQNIFNNVIYNVAHAGISIGCSVSSAVANVYNNTIDMSVMTGNQGSPCAAWTGVTVNSGNNICISPGGGLGSMSGVSSNYLMSTSEAATYGFVPSNKYHPTSSDPNVAGQGLNLASMISECCRLWVPFLRYSTMRQERLGSALRTTRDLLHGTSAHSSSTVNPRAHRQHKPNPPSSFVARAMAAPGLQLGLIKPCGRPA